MITTKFASFSYLILVLVASLLMFPTLDTDASPNYADCMRNPFASFCRGISAKRSQMPSVNRGGQIRGESTIGNNFEGNSLQTQHELSLPPPLPSYENNQWRSSLLQPARFRASMAMGGGGGGGGGLNDMLLRFWLESLGIRQVAPTQKRSSSPSREFFEPLEPLYEQVFSSDSPTQQASVTAA